MLATSSHSLLRAEHGDVDARLGEALGGVVEGHQKGLQGLHTLPRLLLRCLLLPGLQLLPHFVHLLRKLVADLHPSLQTIVGLGHTLLRDFEVVHSILLLGDNFPGVSDGLAGCLRRCLCLRKTLKAIVGVNGLLGFLDVFFRICCQLLHLCKQLGILLLFLVPLQRCRELAQLPLRRLKLRSAIDEAELCLPLSGLNRRYDLQQEPGDGRLRIFDGLFCLCHRFLAGLFLEDFDILRGLLNCDLDCAHFVPHLVEACV
mmetsp:Transcript_26601/g.57784  ORF Transcript_26601/g.57784 Transcript_26601/m.57784 type:complete len:259 (+) Transcript_26601:3070-3846(+)